MKTERLIEAKKQWESELLNAISDSDRAIIQKRISKIVDQLGQGNSVSVVPDKKKEHPTPILLTEEEEKKIELLIKKRSNLKELYNLFHDDDVLVDLNQIEAELKQYRVLDGISKAPVVEVQRVEMDTLQSVYGPRQIKQIMDYFDNRVFSFDVSNVDRIKQYNDKVKNHSSLSNIEISYWDSLFAGKDTIRESELIDIIIEKQNLKKTPGNCTKVLNEIIRAEYQALIVPESFPSQYNNHIYKRKYVNK